MSKPPKKNLRKPSQDNITKPASQLSNKFNLFIENNKTGLLFAGIYFIVMAIVSFTFHKVGDYGVETDFFWSYVPNAREFLKGVVQIDPFRGPLYPIVLALFGFVIKDFFTAGVLIGVLSASFVIYFSFELIKRIFSPLISFFVTLAMIVNPVFIQYTYSAGTDMFFNALAAGTLFFFLKDKKFSYLNIILAGFIGGLSYLTRYNGIFLLGFIIVILFVNYMELKWIDRIKASLIFTAVFLITFAPWGFYCLSGKGSFIYNDNYKNIAFELYGKDKMSWDQFWFKESSKYTSIKDVVSRDPGKFITTVVSNVGFNFVSDMERLMGWQWGVFVFAGLFLLIFSKLPVKKNKLRKQNSAINHRWKNRETAFYLLNIIFFGLLTVVFYSERFSLFLIPFYSLLAIQLFLNSEIKFSNLIPVKTAYVILPGIIIYTIISSVMFNSSRINAGPTDLLTLRDWSKKNLTVKEGDKVAARKPHVAYYLGMDFYLIPLEDSYDAFINKLKAEGVNYLYISEIEAYVRPEFYSLIDYRSKHPGLSTVVYFKNPPSVLYRVLK